MKQVKAETASQLCVVSVGALKARKTILALFPASVRAVWVLSITNVSKIGCRSKCSPERLKITLLFSGRISNVKFANSAIPTCLESINAFTSLSTSRNPRVAISWWWNLFLLRRTPAGQSMCLYSALSTVSSQWDVVTKVWWESTTFLFQDAMQYWSIPQKEFLSRTTSLNLAPWYSWERLKFNSMKIKTTPTKWVEVCSHLSLPKSMWSETRRKLTRKAKNKRKSLKISWLQATTALLWEKGSSKE